MKTKNRINKYPFTVPLTLGVFIAIHSCQRIPEQDTRAPSVRETVDLPLQDPTAQVATFTQIERKRLEQTVTIPATATYSDVFKQQESLPPKIDILILIDNSGSMEEEQLNLSDKLTSLLADLSEVDWQINVITTDNSCQRSPELPLTPDTENMESIFVDAVRAGTLGSGYEMALARTLDHLQGQCTTYPAWKRDNTDFALLIVSDEDEDTYSSYHNQGALFMSEMKSLGYVGGKTFKTYGIVGHPDEPCPSAFDVAHTYADVIDLSDGLWGSICDADYSDTLAAISRDIRLNLKTDFPLRFTPVLTTIKLQLDGNAYAGNWTLVGQRIILSESLPEGSTLVVTYQTESFRLLRLGDDVDGYALEAITINGKDVDPELYHYDPSANTILLTFDPKAGEVITTSLIENKSLRTEFSLPKVGDKGVGCYLGNELIASTYDAKNGKVSIIPPIPSGATVHCLY